MGFDLTSIHFGCWGFERETFGSWCLGKCSKWSGAGLSLLPLSSFPFVNRLFPRGSSPPLFALKPQECVPRPRFGREILVSSLNLERGNAPRFRYGQGTLSYEFLVRFELGFVGDWKETKILYAFFLIFFSYFYLIIWLLKRNHEWNLKTMPTF